ncbi:hypothetical protein L7F22_062724 [Adiantum nelumboides]|nr:hypothetical protein [Adiantum nelumboides]MCO5608513.1 hypothetical protein [Adiantum nelumboides]
MGTERTGRNGRLLVAALTYCMLLTACWLPRTTVAELVEETSTHTSSAATGAVEADDNSSYVIVLDADNFTEVVAQHDFIVVEFYAPWCGHCQHFAPEYEKAAALLHHRQPAIVLAKIDADVHRELAMQHDVQSIPHLVIFQNAGSTTRPYKGPLYADGVVAYLTKQASPPCPQITSSDEGVKLAQAADFLVVGVFPGSDSSNDLVKSFISVAAELQSDYDIKYTLDESFLAVVPDSIAIDASKPSIYVFKSFDEGLHVFQGGVDFTQAEAVKKLLDDVSMPHVVWFNKDPVQQEYLTKIFSEYTEDAQAYLLVDAAAPHFDELQTAYKQMAKENHGKGLRFIAANMVDGKPVIEYFGVKEEKLPVFFIRSSDEKKKYVLDQADAASMAAWLQGYFRGEVAEYLKSEPVPEQNEGPVKVVVRDTMEAMVLQSEKNVLLELYAPWCGHCKTLAPILEELAAEMQVTHPDVVIAKLDATANDVGDERFQAQGYPTMYLRVAASGDVIKFQAGQPTKEAILDFINANLDLEAISPLVEPKDEL